MVPFLRAKEWACFDHVPTSQKDKLVHSREVCQRDTRELRLHRPHKQSEILQQKKHTEFQHRLFLRITTLLTWLKSTLLLKNKCFDTTIYMKTQCLKTNETQHYWKGKCLRSDRWSRERVAALIKSLVYARWKRDALDARLPNRAENVSW